MGRFSAIFRICLMALLMVLSSDVSQARQETVAQPEDKVVAFDAKMHDFGDVPVSAGPLEWSFTFKNISSDPIVVHNVISSCGCTTPEWTKSPVMPQDTGHVRVIFSNDQGAYPFDKSLTVYVSGVNRPVVLRIRGHVHEKNFKLADLYPVRAGRLGLRERTASIGYMDQGTVKSDVVQVANLSRQPLAVSAFATDRGLAVHFDVNPIPPMSTANMTVTVDSGALGGEKWGKQSFTTGIVAGSERIPACFTVTAFIKDNFAGIDDVAVDRAASPVPELSYFDFGKVAAGARVNASYRVSNTGSEPLVIHKIESDKSGVQFIGKCPVTVEPGSASVLKFKYDTSKVSGETIVVLTLITNSPAKPLLNLFVTGTVTK